MSAGVLELRLEQGVAFVRVLTYKDSAGVLVDVSGYYLELSIRRYKDSATAIGQYDNASKGGLSVVGLGLIQVRIPGDATGAMSFGRGVWELRGLPPGAQGNATRLLNGMAYLNKRVA